MSQKDDYTHEELLFALQVRKLAHQIRMEKVPGHLLNDQSKSELDKWFEDNPLAPFVKTAMQEIRRTAETIRDNRS